MNDVNHIDLTRVPLYKKLPIRTPFTISVFVADACNFKCKYCHQYLSDEKLKELNFKKSIMSFEVYKNLIDDISKFEDKLKLLLLYGNGEPLLNKNIAEMVAYAKRKDIAERVEIITNGVLLTPDLSDSLIDAGLDRLRISIQGTTAKKYDELCGAKIDFEKFIENIKYFYSKKSKAEIYIKIIDVALNDKDDEKYFYSIFSPIADSVAVEYMAPFNHNHIDYSKLSTDFSRSIHGKEITNIEVCSGPFYTLVVNPDGSVVPCCHVPAPLNYGNIADLSLKEIWESKLVKNFLFNQLNDRQKFNTVCAGCESLKYIQRPEDILDYHKDELKKEYKLLID